jgi:hypothetical protein
MLGRRQLVSSLSLSLVLSLSATLVACGPGNEPKMADVKAGAMPAGEEWNGVYYSQLYGYLHLVSDNRSASGAWRNTAGDAWGEMSGQCDGDLFKYEWTERKIGAIGADATKKGHGYFKYTKPKPDEAAKIVGQWGLGESEAGNPWEAVKQIRMEPKPDSVRPDEIEGRTNVGGWDDEGGEKPEDSSTGEKKSDGDPAAP